MNIIDLPDDVLVFIFKKYINLKDLISISNTCNRFLQIIETYKLWNKFLYFYPILDLNYPYGFSEYFMYSKSYTQTYTDFNKLKTYLNLVNKKYNTKVFYSFPEKMLPCIQIDDETNDHLGFTSVYLTDANKIIWLNLNEIYNHISSSFQKNQFNSLVKHSSYASYKYNSTFKNDIKIVKQIKIFNHKDIRSFKKKNNILVSFSENSIKVHSQEKNMNFELVNQIKDTGIKINCVDFTTKLNKLVYGCSNGLLKVYNLKDENIDLNENDFEPVEICSLNDRILRCVISPSLKNLAIGTAGIKPCNGNLSCPLRIYDFEKLKEIQTIKNPGAHKIGNGVLALSFINENTIMSAGYDTFIRIFDLRSSQCIQSLEEPEDMSIYTVCCSKYYGLLSGNDRQSIIRYWDRRANKIISTFLATNFNSSIYSLACTPESILACWDHGVSCIDLR